MGNCGARVVISILVILVIAGCSDGKTVSTDASTSSAAAKPVDRGHLETVNAKSISGWAWNHRNPDDPVDVNIYDGDTLITSVSANGFRQDLLDGKKGNGKHHFSCTTPASFLDNKEHTVHARVAGTDIELVNSPKVVRLKPR